MAILIRNLEGWEEYIHGLPLRYDCGVCPEELRKTTEKFDL
jgi:hypothetical protein